jgi:hypothetical protein
VARHKAAPPVRLPPHQQDGLGELRIDAVYVQIMRFPFSKVDDDTLVAAARQLEPVPGD